MEGAIAYLHQKYKSFHCSDIIYRTNLIAQNVISDDFSQSNAIAIIYHKIYWVTNVAGGTITFLDQFAAPIFITPNAVGTNCWADMPLVRNGAKLFVQASPSILNTIPFSIAFQFITL